MTTYVPIKTLCEKTGLSDKTIRRLIRRESLPICRVNRRGKILVDVEAFARYMESTKVTVRQDPLVMEILKDLKDFMRR
jgi:excisionase family DNA binding protein